MTAGRPRPLRGLLAGAVGGFVGAWAIGNFMTKVTPTLSEILEAEKKHHEGTGGNGSASPGDASDESESQGGDPRVQVATVLAERVLHHPLLPEEKKAAGPVMHYAMGTVSGAILGLASEYVPLAHSGLGLPFGAAVWAVAPNAALPALGLAPPPVKTPAEDHAMNLLSHLVYGFTTEMVRRNVRGVV